jgi:hypothetical protein
MRNGDLRKKYDVIVLTSISAQEILDGRKAGTVPSQYAGGLGNPGLATLIGFVNGGGR